MVEFRKLARVYEVLTDQQLKELIENSDWMEICHGS